MAGPQVAALPLLSAAPARFRRLAGSGLAAWSRPRYACPLTEAALPGLSASLGCCAASRGQTAPVVPGYLSSRWPTGGRKAVDVLERMRACWGPALGYGKSRCQEAALERVPSDLRAGYLAKRVGGVFGLQPLHVAP